MRAAKKRGSELKVVTVLFADIAGFTAASEKLDPEEISNIMNKCWDALDKIIIDFGGVINRHEGDRVLALFGAPEAHEDDPERAINAALAMLKEIEVFNRKFKNMLHEPLGLHIGINTGQVMAGVIGSRFSRDYTVMGDTVNIASRLEENANTGEILVSERTYKTAEPTFKFKRLASMKVKGKKDPIEVYKVLGVEKQPSPKIISKFVGRAKELNILEKAIGALKDGKSNIVFILGEAGFGKTRLIEELRVRNENISWFGARSLSYGTNISYLVFLELLRKIYEISESDSASSVKEKIIEKTQFLFPQEWQDIVPYVGDLFSIKFGNELDDKVRYLDAKALRFQIFLSVKRIFTAIAKQEPTVFVIDNLQWLDSTSLDLFEFILDLVRETASLFICSARLEKDTQWWEMKERLKDRYKKLTSEILLDRLDDKESKELVKTGQIPDNLLREILSKSEGNPFYIEEIMRSISDVDYRSLSVEIPDTIYGAIAARIDRLEPAAKDVLQVASVIGRRFSYSILRHVLSEERGAKGKKLLDACIQYLQEREFIIGEQNEPEPRYAFKQRLIQEIAYDSLLKKNRREIHWKVGGVIEELYRDRLEDYYEVLAYHYYNSDDLKKALRYCEMSGDKAKGDYANQEAIDYYTKAIQLASQKGKKAELFEKRGDVYNLMANYDKTLGDYEASLRLYLKNKKKAQVERKIGNIFYAKGEFDVAISAYESSMQKLKNEKSPELAEITVDLARASCEGRGKYESSLHMVEDALNTVRVEKNPDLVAKGYNTLGRIYWFKGDHDKALENYETALAIYQELGDKARMGILFSNIGRVYLNEGSLDKAMEYFNRHAALSDEIGQRHWTGGNLRDIGNVYLYKGNLDESLECYTRALEISEEIGDKQLSGIVTSNIGYIHQERNDLDKALWYYMKALSMADKIGYKRGIAHVCSRIGSLYSDKKDFGEALHYLRRAENVAIEVDDKSALSSTYINLAEMKLLMHKPDAAYEFADKALSIAKGRESKVREIQALRVLGKTNASIDRVEEAVKYLKDSISMAEKGGYDLEIAKSCFTLGLILKETGKDEAQFYLKRAKTIFEKSGAQKWLKKLDSH
jgi:class 3 adenylate cyclase/tetratricopeptide (TPR) repeat protein